MTFYQDVACAIQKANADAILASARPARLQPQLRQR